MIKDTNHTFVICAYKEIPYLEECVKSLKDQTVKSKIIISTSTPNDFVKNVAKKYDVELMINPEKKGHMSDICFAYEQAKTKYVTLCHQDDIYDKEFAQRTLKKLEKNKNTIIAFTNYHELRNEKLVKINLLLLVKRLINFPLKIFKKSKKIRLFTLSLGNAICAPTVTYNKDIVERPLNQSDFKSNVDWDTWIQLANKKGAYIYISKPLLKRRIHEESLTTEVIANNTKGKEDFEIFCRFWPKSIAKILVKIYSNSEKSNIINEKGQKKVNKMQILMVMIYLILTVSGLILYKYGANQGFALSISSKVFELKISIISIIGLVCYLFSFIMYMVILPKFNISFIFPIMSAISYIGIFTLSILVLKEKITTTGVIGSIIILIGIITMNIGNK